MPVYYYFFAILLCFSYLGIMLFYHRGWKSLPSWKIPKRFEPQTTVTVLVAARNEAGNILSCLRSILAQRYPPSLFKVIVIDDHSTDQTADLVEQLEHPLIEVIRLADLIDTRGVQSFKKKAIETGIAHAGGELIVTTDADCQVPPEWLALLVSFYEAQNCKLIAAPVNFYGEQNGLERFQSLDLIGMMGITGAGISRRFTHMCNGANLAYQRAAFHAVKGFEGIDRRASGDDMLLLQKISRRYPGQVGFVKNRKATVLTSAQPDWSSFFQQRLRWASKSKDYREWWVTLILAVVFLFCLNIILSLLLVPFVGREMLWIFFGQLAVKSMIDYFFLRSMTRFFERTDLMKSFWMAQFLHISYITTIGLAANLIPRYEWKGRKVK